MKHSFSTISDVYAFLDQRPMFGKVGAKAANFGLESISSFMDFLGNPQKDLKYIHVAGTNGKGSVSAMLYSIYHFQGYKTALYTSPHLKDYTERFLCAGKRPSDSDLVEFFQKASLYNRFDEVTYFELSTAFAFWWFQKSDADLCIIEVGLGGRLDATNIIEQPLCSVITSIGFDHMDILGDTLAKIAAEKAGIIKKNSPTILGKLSAEAENEIMEIARAKQSELIHYNKELAKWISSDLVEIDFEGEKITLEPSLQSRTQTVNMSTVLNVVSKIKGEFTVTKTSIKNGLEQTSELADFRGRFEKLDSKLNWFFDGGHNEEALTQTKITAEAKFGKDVVWVFSMMSDKIKPFLNQIFQNEASVYYYQMDTERAGEFDVFHYMFPNAIKLENQNLESRLKNFSDKNVVFAGSFYFYETVTSWLNTYL